jgi:hypothetical protein
MRGDAIRRRYPDASTSVTPGDAPGGRHELLNLGAPGVEQPGFGAAAAVVEELWSTSQ